MSLSTLLAGPNAIKTVTLKNGNQYSYMSGLRSTRNLIDARMESNNKKKTPYDGIAFLLFMRLVDDEGEPMSKTYDFKDFAEALDYDEALSIASAINGDDKNEKSLDDQTAEAIKNLRAQRGVTSDSLSE